MMFLDNDDHDFFAITPARRSPIAIYKQALQVFAADWRTFLICSSLKLAATVGYINVQLHILVLFTTGRTVSSPLVTLARMSDREQFLLFFVWFCSTLAFLVISSAIQASTVRAVTNVYTGFQLSSPSYTLDTRSIGRLFYFQLALWNACGLALLLTAGVVLICLANPEMSYVSWYSLAVIILLSLDIIKDVNAVMISMASCLVVEQQGSLMDAAKSCWRLCKDSLWTINLTLLGMVLMELVIDMGAMIFRNDVSRMDILLATCGTLVSLSCLPFNMIIGTVIYVSLRIEKDGLTQDGLLQELRGVVAARNNNEGVVLDEDPLLLMRKRLLDDVDNSVV